MIWQYVIVGLIVACAFFFAGRTMLRKRKAFRAPAANSSCGKDDCGCGS